jgi:hypothetical protein
MAEFEAFVARQTRDRDTSNVLNFARAPIVIRDIPGPEGIPLMNTPWTLLLDGEEIASGETDEEGRVNILNALDPEKTYELQYPGRSITISKTELEGVDSVKGMQQRFVELGYNPGPVDGDHGPRTKWALMEFQNDHALEVDGIYGPQSTKKLTEVFGE